VYALIHLSRDAERTRERILRLLSFDSERLISRQHATYVPLGNQFDVRHSWSYKQKTHCWAFRDPIITHPLPSTKTI